MTIPYGEHFTAVLVLNRPDRLELVTVAQVAQLGQDLEDLVRIAARQTVQHELLALDVRDHDLPSGGAVRLLASDGNPFVTTALMSLSGSCPRQRQRRARRRTAVQRGDGVPGAGPGAGAGRGVAQPDPVDVRGRLRPSPRTSSGGTTGSSSRCGSWPTRPTGPCRCGCPSRWPRSSPASAARTDLSGEKLVQLLRAQRLLSLLGEEPQRLGASALVSSRQQPLVEGGVLTQLPGALGRGAARQVVVFRDEFGAGSTGEPLSLTTRHPGTWYQCLRRSAGSRAKSRSAASARRSAGQQSISSRPGPRATSPVSAGAVSASRSIIGGPAVTSSIRMP